MTDRPSVALRQIGMRGTAGTDADSNALENVVTGELSDGAEAFIVANRSTYRFKLGDQSTPLLGDRILPVPNDAGRWFEQGGETLLERELATELAADVLVGAGLTVELLQLTVPAAGRCFLDILGDLSATWTNTGDLELQVFLSIDGGAFAEVNAGAVQSGANLQMRVMSVGATAGPFQVATQTLAVSLCLRNGLASDVTVSPAGGNAATLRVQVKRASVGSVEPGMIWYCASNGGGGRPNMAMAGYLPNQLAASVSTMPAVAILTPFAQDEPWRFRPDPSDPTKVWLLNSGGSAPEAYLARHSRDQLGQDGAPDPEIACDLNPARNSANFVVDFAFVPGIGKCVVVTLGTIRVYDIASLVSGVPVPTAIITVGGATLNEGILVSGNDVFVASYTGSFMYKLTAADLTGAGGLIVPSVILTGSNWTGGIEYMDYMPNGDLAITFFDVNEVRVYSAASVSVSGNPAPLVIVDISVAPTGAQGVMVDDDGNVFVSNYNNGDLYKFLASQMQTSGSKAPAMIFGTDAMIGSGGTITLDRGTP